MYLISGDEIKLGDVILTRENTAVSKVVRLATKSEFSHAMLYVGDSSYIHSDADGVHSGNLQRLLFESDKNVIVLRIDCSQLEKEKACNFARNKIGTSYSVKEAVNAKLKISKKSIENRQFCSRLVVQAYDYAGVSLVEDVDFCTPQEIIESENTINTEIVPRMATTKEIELAKTYNPIQRQTEITNYILQSVRDITSKDIQTLEQVMGFVIQFPQYDEVVSRVFKESGYLTMWEHEVENNEWRYDATILLNLPVPSDQLIKLAFKEQNMAKNRLTRYQSNYWQYLSLYNVHGGECLGDQVKLYEKLISITKNCLNATSNVLGALSE